MAQLFDRAGKPAEATHRSTTGKPYTTRQAPCGRCGGAGGAAKWAHTGWTCYDCGGHGRGSVYKVPLYTAEQLTKLVARKAVADAKRQAVADARAATEQAEADVRRASFEAAHGQFLSDVAAMYPEDEFVQDVVRKSRVRCSITARQLDALTTKALRDKAERERRAQAQHVGKLGDKIQVNGVIKFFTAFETQFGWLYISVIRDQDGNTLVYKGAKRLVEGTEMQQRGQRVQFAAKIKAHDWRDGEPQTIVSHPSKIVTLLPLVRDWSVYGWTTQ